MRLFVTDAGGWPDRTSHGSREWSYGYRECSAGSGGQRVCNGCTWACFTCVWRLAMHAMYRACSVAMEPGRVTWEPQVSKGSPLASVVCSAVDYSASRYHLFPMRLFVTDAGEWLDSVAHGSREWSHGYRESSVGSGGKCVYNENCTWACSTCVRRPATHAMYRACSMAMKPGHLTWGRRFCRRSPLASVVCTAGECYASQVSLYPMRLFVSDAGGWPDRTAHGSREWSRGYCESSDGSGGQHVCNGCTWACFMCVWRSTTHAMYRACSVAMKPGRVTWGRCVSHKPPWPRLSARLLSIVPGGITFLDASVSH
jgi:hypothetical protein